MFQILKFNTKNKRKNEKLWNSVESLAMKY